MIEPIAREQLEQQAAPPFGKSWGRWYAAVLSWLALLILLFSIITFTYSR